MVAADSDAQLMARYQAGEARAFAELYARYHPLLLAFARRRLHDDATASDVVQQAFLNLHLARSDFALDRPLRPWLVTIVANLVRDHFRSRGRKRETELPDEQHLGTTEGPSAVDELERWERMQATRDAVTNLPEPHRIVVTLHWLEERPFPEVAAELGERVSTVKVRAHRAYKKLREQLAPAAVA